ncbi:MAG: DNA-directed RNA polymerase subunit beta [Bacilli bacterium]|nr:DNA-directed RNA polymerase subunit beta [Bacilli bacterium]
MENKWKLVKYGKFHERINFARNKENLELPNLIENQIDSFDWFVTEGIKELLVDISPINHPTGKQISIEFSEPFFEEPERSIRDCKERELSYTKKLKCKVNLINGEVGEIKEATIFLADFPWMTPTGSFVINGAERVVVNQIIRSSGVLFKNEMDPKLNKANLTGQVIPTRGAWIEFEKGSKDLLYAKVDRSKKIFLTTFLRCLGIETKSQMTSLFGKSELLEKTIEKNEHETYDEAMSELYLKVKGESDSIASHVQSYLQNHLMDTKRYDLMEVGRYKFNKKLDFSERAFGHALAEDYVIEAKTDDNGNIIQERIVLAKGTMVDEEVRDILKANRESFRKELNYKNDLYVDWMRGHSAENVKTLVETIKVFSGNADGGKNKTVKIVGSYFDEEKTFITTSDMIAATSYYLNLLDGVGECDDVDNLANRRMRLTGELLKNQVRVGFAKLEKNIKDKMTTKEPKDMTPQNLINSKPLESAIKEFFALSQLSQFMAQTNPLDEITHKRRLSALGPGGITRERAGIEVRDVHPTHYGRICPVETPEGQNIGLISSLATYAKVNEYGFIKTAYYKVVDGVVTDEAVYMTADEEYNEYIADANAKTVTVDGVTTLTEDFIYARHNLETNLYSRDQISYIDVSSKQIVSVSAACIPFLEHDDCTRTLMGSNMQRQSIPLIRPQAPYVGTGIEYKAAHDSGAALLCLADGVVEYVDGKVVRVREEGGALREYELAKFQRSNQGTCFNQTPICEVGEIVKKGDVLADGPSMDKGELALGRNVLIAFMTWEGYNFEDAVIMNENLVKNDVYTSIHIERYECQARDTKLGKEQITAEMASIPSASRKNLDADGIVIPGSVVKEGDYLVAKSTPRGQTDPSPEEKLMEAIFGNKSKEQKDTSLTVPHGGDGIVQAVRHYKKPQDKELPNGVNEVVRVYIVQKRKIRVGDKMSGRHGNKGVISNILPQEDMPFLADGTPIDIMLNPQGVPSRMNIGQVLEVHLGMACRKLGCLAATEVFDCCRDEDLADLMAQAGMTPDGKVEVFDGRTGEKFDNRVNVGVMYMIKLDHMVDDKLHARSVGPYVLVPQQPMGGKAQNGGQRFGEMEVWALEAYGAAYTLQEMLTVKSDDMVGRNKVFRAITEGQEIPKPNLPESFRVFTRELRSLGIYVELIDAETGENVVEKSLVEDDTDNYIQKYHF